MKNEPNTTTWRMVSASVWWRPSGFRDVTIGIITLDAPRACVLQGWLALKK